MSYHALLKAEQVSFQEDARYLTAGTIKQTCGFVLFISCRALDTPEMLKQCLPVTRQTECPFILVKNQNLQYQLNSGSFGNEIAGKVLSLYPADRSTLSILIKELVGLTTQLKGPQIINAQRLSQVVYIQKAEKHTDGFRYSMPKPRDIPYSIPLIYLKKEKPNRLLGNYYLPVQLLGATPKGKIFKAINLRKLKFEWCLIKQGNAVALDDQFDRDMKDRLKWQKAVLERIKDKVYTPGYLDYFEKAENTYLVIDYVEGKSLGQEVRNAMKGTTVWKEFPIHKKEQLLNWYQQAVGLVDSIHQEGFVHRDITDSNFMIGNDGRLCIIDFELSYSLREQQPDPPYLLGTFGYASPEQLHYQYPDIRDDVYSLGALLSFVLTGCQPYEFLNTPLTVVRSKIVRLTGSDLLATLVCRCIQPTRKARASLSAIKEAITIYLENLAQRKYETSTMAV
ncbi:protein kinase [Mucilaginibacter sp. PAMB04168]|uniref:serine/threonine protein kinase n=1 Tax=Mucilaginibacter sp. PAMB04168 TaxID=3138567 RepID=UPI0031F65844